MRCDRVAMEHAMRIVFLFVSALLLAVACKQPRNQHLLPVPSGSSVSIVSISPSTAEPLRPGTYVRLKVDVAYKLEVDDGEIGLVVQAADGSPLARDIEIVTRGTGEATLQAEFIVPPTKAIEIFFALAAPEQGATSPVARHTYKVAPA